MGSREQVAARLNQLELGIKDLDIAYEQYFTGIERVTPEKQRQTLLIGMQK